MRTRSRRAVEAARGLIDELGLTEPSEIDVELIAAYLGVYVRYRPLGNQEGHLLRSGDAGLVVVDEAATTSSKWRFVIGHELGHFMLHPDEDQLHVCTDGALRETGRITRQEYEANDFAAELLMPSAMFAPRVARISGGPPTIWEVSALARAFDTSLTATALRFILHTQEACALAHVTGGRIDWWTRTRAFVPRLRPGAPIPEGTLTAAVAAGEHAPSVSVPSEPLAWSKTMRAARLELFEHAVSLGGYGSVLALLWHGV
jgi:Zn-dependent peptidase ImmA (M78 family)